MPNCTVVCQCFSICWGPAMALPSLQKWALQQDICGQRLLTYSKRMVDTAWNGPRNLHGMFMQLLPCTRGMMLTSMIFPVCPLPGSTAPARAIPLDKKVQLAMDFSDFTSPRSCLSGLVPWVRGKMTELKLPRIRAFQSWKQEACCKTSWPAWNGQVEFS